jgi:PhnB protein
MEETMTTQAKPIPTGFHTVTPNLVVRDTDKAIDFYKRALGAEERNRFLGPDQARDLSAALRPDDQIHIICALSGG